ncbi:hypothetical protein [Moorena producens]|nr:hypothetical protein [Moorena producens]
MQTSSVCPRLIAIGTETPPQKCTQSQVLELFGITDKRINKIFSCPAKEAPHLMRSIGVG